MPPVQGKSALVTGGARRIGRAIALALARDGANVAITYLRSQREAKTLVKDLEALGVGAMAVECDVRDQKSVRSAAKKVLAEFHSLDSLINNAAMYETTAFGN